MANVSVANAQGASNRVFIDSPNANGVYMRCMGHTARSFNIPIALFYAMAHQEHGYIGAKIANKSRRTGKVMSYDYGLFQINSRWINLFKHSLAIDETLVANNGCANIWLAGYIFNYERSHFSRGDNWRAVGNYHSKDSKIQKRYVNKVRKKYNDIILKIRGANREM